MTLFHKQCGKDGLPCIVLTSEMPLRTVTERALEILKERNKTEPFIFQRSGRLVTIRTVKRERAKDGKLVKEKVIVAIDLDILRGMLTRSMNFVRINQQGRTIQVDPPQTVAKDLLSIGNWSLPILAGLTEVPTLRPDGSILDVPGYDLATQLVYLPDATMHIPEVAEKPGRAEVEEAKSIIYEVIGDFPFDSDASAANAVGALLTAVIRPAIDGHVPFLLIDATRAGTGKSKFADILAYAATGQMGAFKGAPDNNAEWGKVITTTLMEGGQINIFDNIRARLDSSALDRLVTSHYWSDRVLGTNENVKLANRGVWLATGNDIIIGGDLPRRVYRIGLDAGTATPWNRRGADEDTEFINLDEWLPVNRGRLVWAVLTIARAWYAVGKPIDKSLPVFGSFEEWARTIGGMLKHAGISQFLNNLVSYQFEADYENRQWAQFVQALHDQFEDREFTTSDISKFVMVHDAAERTLAGSSECDLCDALPDHIAYRGKTEQDFKARLGLAVAKRKSRIFDDTTRYSIVASGDSHKKTNVYRIIAKKVQRVKLR